MAFIDDMSDTMRKVFLAGVGAVATTAEKSSQIVDDLEKSGGLTAEQCKALNEEPKQKASEAGSDSEAAVLRTRLKNMRAAERAAYVEKIAKIKDELDAEPVVVDVEDETSSDESADDAAK